MKKMYQIAYSKTVRRWTAMQVDENNFPKILCIGKTPAECFEKLDKADGLDKKAIFAIEIEQWPF